MIGILGSGFGLYGYLPAIAQTTTDAILLQERYKDKFYKRNELLEFESRIRWVENLDRLFDESKTLVISLPPFEQEWAILKSLEYSNINTLLLEKPLSVTPNSSESLLNQILKSNKKFRIGYTFCFTNWADSICEEIKFSRLSKIVIKWDFCAHHYKNELDVWKRFHNQGGSVVRFYGIHLIALASKIGYSEIQYSKSLGYSDNEVFKWESDFCNEHLPSLNVCINSNSKKTNFSIQFISYDNTDIPLKQINLIDPFDNYGNILYENIDSRVFLLKKIIKTLLSDEKSEEMYNSYELCNTLWKNIEQINSNSII